MKNIKLKIKSFIVLIFILILSCNKVDNKKNIKLIKNFKKVLASVLLLLKTGKNVIINNRVEKLNRSSCLKDNHNCTIWTDCCYGTCLNGICYSSQQGPCNETKNCFNFYPFYNYSCDSEYCQISNTRKSLNKQKTAPICLEPCKFWDQCTSATCLNNCCCSSQNAPCNEYFPCCLEELGLYKCINGKCESTNSTQY